MPSAIKAPAARPFALPFQVGITVYLDANIAFDGPRYPLVMLSHGRGGNRFNQAWLAQYLASHGSSRPSIPTWRTPIPRRSSTSRARSGSAQSTSARASPIS